MDTKRTNEDTAKWLSALAEPTRLNIVRQLADGKKSVSEIAQLTGVPVVNASHHLQKLQTADILESSREGRFIYYSIKGAKIKEGMVILDCNGVSVSINS